MLIFTLFHTSSHLSLQNWQQPHHPEKQDIWRQEWWCADIQLRRRPAGGERHLLQCPGWCVDQDRVKPGPQEK